MQSEAQQHQLTGTIPSSAGNIQQFTPAQIQQWKQRYMPEAIAPRPVSRGAGGVDSRTIAILAIAFSAPITIIGGLVVITGSSGTASQERVIAQMMQQQALMQEQLNKPRQICILASCPPPEPVSTVPTVQPVPAQTSLETVPAVEQTSGWFQPSTVTLADGSVVEIPQSGGGY